MASWLKNKVFWFGLLLLVVMVGLIRYTATERQDISPVEKLVRDAFTPLQSGVNRFRDSLGRLDVVFSDKRVLADKNRRLEQEISRLKQQNQVLLEYRYENERLREMLDFHQRSLDVYQLQTAEVIARSPELWYSTLTINRGERDGIAKNMVVITPDGLLGRIISTSVQTAEVLLISDRESAVGALIQESRTQGLVEGLGDRNLLRMVNVPYDSSVRKGQVVVTSGLSEIFPKGLKIGKVIKVGHEPSGLLKYAIIKPSINFNELEEVFVIVNVHTRP